MKDKTNTFNLLTFLLSIVIILSVVSRFSFSIISTSIILLLLSIPTLLIFNNYKFGFKFFIPVAAFTCACVISLYSADCQINVRDCLLMLFSSVLAGINMFFVPFNLRKKLFIVPIFIALWLAMIIFTRFITNINGFFTGDNFFEMFAININIIAGFLLLIYPLLYIYIKEEDFKTSKIYIFIALFILLAICITKSRSAIFLSFIATLFFLLEYKKNIYIKILIATVITVLVSLIVYVSVLKSATNSFSDRLIWWQTAYLIFKQNILFGCGFCNYSVLFKTFRPELVVNTLYAHNIIFQLLADTGIVGLSCFIWLIISFYKKIIYEIKTNSDKIYFKAIAVSITLFLLLNLDDYSFFIPANMLTFFILMASVFVIDYKKLKKQKINNIILVLIFIIIMLVVIKPVIAERYYKTGLDYYAAKRYSLSKEYFQKAIIFDNKNSQYYYQLSNANFSIFDLDRKNNILYAQEAIENTKQALKYYKNSGQLWANLAILYWNIDDKENAIKYIKQALVYDKFNYYYEEYYDKFTNS